MGDLVKEIVSAVDYMRNIADYRRSHRKECGSLVRKLKVLLPLLKEIRNMDVDEMPPAAVDCLYKLKKASLSAKKLLVTCHCGSKIYLAVENESIMGRFHSVSGKICKALDGMPYDELGISEEEKEQVESMRAHIRRTKKRIDTQDMEFTMDVMVALATENDRNADFASVERLANKFALRTPEELQAETLAVRKLVVDRNGHHAESTQQIIDLLNKLKKVAGVPETDVLDNSGMPKSPDRSPDKSPSQSIPHDFLCPITLEIMTDPVIVSSGQTYERVSIQEWFDSGHQTCPKSGQELSNLTLVPNFALKNLIHQWCAKKNFQLPTKEPPATTTATTSPEKNPTDATSSNDGGETLSIVQELSSSHLDVQRRAVAKIRMLSKESPENRTMIVNVGGIKPLVELLSYPDSKIREHAVTAILNLSIDESNKKLISEEEPLAAIIETLQNGSICAQENSAAALFSLSMIDENKVKIGEMDGIPPLVMMLKTGTIRGKKDAVTALFPLCLIQCNRTIAIDAGIIPILISLLDDKNVNMVDEMLSIISLLALNPEGRQNLGQLSFIEMLVNMIRDGTQKNKECATAVLLELCSKNSNLILAALQYGVYEHLVEVCNDGTIRAKRKANAVLQLMTTTEQLY